MTWHKTFTTRWWLDEQLHTTCWWLWHTTLLNNDLTWHSNTHYVLMTHVDDLTCYIYCVLMTWCPLTHHVLMTLTYDTLLYNDSLPIHDLTSWRLTAHRWLDLTFKHPLRTCWWLMLMTWRLTFTVYCDLMSAHSLCVDDFDVWHPTLQWLTAHPRLDVLTSHYSTVTWLDIETPTMC